MTRQVTITNTSNWTDEALWVSPTELPTWQRHLNVGESVIVSTSTPTTLMVQPYNTKDARHSPHRDKHGNQIYPYAKTVFRYENGKEVPLDKLPAELLE